MVCTGNICRSPAMHYLAAREWGDAAEVTSAGTHAETGMDATPEMRRTAATYGLTFPRHRPTQLTAGMISRSGLVLVATEGHARWIAGEMGGLPPHVFGVKQAAELASRADAPSGATPAERLLGAAEALRSAQDREPAPLRSLDDPWARDTATYDRVMGEIVDAIGTLTEWVDLR
jgi:protein-tyrosine phosphatase